MAALLKMKKRSNVVILGDGRIGAAVLYYLKKYAVAKKAEFFLKEKQVRHCDILIGALPGELGEKGLELALRHKKNLIDISDIDPPFYLQARKEIKKRNITVIPGCGFSPGLVNFILGNEFLNNETVLEVEVKSGSLSPKECHFPFLWCFEDLVLEHRIPSWQLIKGKKIKFPPFSNYQTESFFGIKAESYFCASGFENLFSAKNAFIKNFTYRVIRPLGFKAFFQFLSNEGFLKKENFAATKRIVESQKEENLTVAQITVLTPKQKTVWLMKSLAKKNEPLSSMQKITASVPAVIAKLFLENRLARKGLVFMEDLGKDSAVFTRLLKEIRKEGIIIRKVQKIKAHD